MKQEIRKIIREALGMDSETYITKVDLHLYMNDTLGPDDYFGDSTATVEWSLFTDEKTYGFSIIKPRIHKLTLNSEVYRAAKDVFVEDKLENIEKVYDFGSGIIDGNEFEGFKLNIEKKENSNSFYPTEVSINEDYKSIDIEFQYP
jgi:acyl carrier protein